MSELKINFYPITLLDSLFSNYQKDAENFYLIAQHLYRFKILSDLLRILEPLGRVHCLYQFSN